MTTHTTHHTTHHKTLRTTLRTTFRAHRSSAYAVGALALIALLGACSTEIDGAPRAELAAAPAAEAPARAPSAAARTLELDGAASSVEFVGAKVTGSHRGRFPGPSGRVELGADGAVSAMELSVSTTELEIEPTQLRDHLKSADFFDVEAFPSARFQLASIAEVKDDGAKDDGATHRVTGDLTIHGRTHRVSFPATVQIRDDVVTAAAEFSIDRRDFDITYKGMADDLIKHDVLLDLSLRFGRGA